MDELNEWLRRTSEANLLTVKEQKNIKEAITTLDLTPLTQYAIADLCDAIYKLGQFANSDVKPAPDKLSERTKNWLDGQTAEERLTTIKDICLDWDGYRTAAGLGSLINEILAYAAYPCKNEAHVMSMNEIKSNTCETSKPYLDVVSNIPFYRCGDCDEPIERFHIYCWNCGERIDWNEKK